MVWLVLLVGLLWLGVAPVARAVDPPIALSGSVVFDKHDQPSGPGCQESAFIQFKDTPGIASYHAEIDDTALGHRTFNGPPFDDAAATDPVFITFGPAPAGFHRFFLSAVSGTGADSNCDAAFAGRFSNLVVTGNRDPGTFELRGTVRGVDGQPLSGVKVDETGSGSARIDTTGADGRYLFVLPRGSYTVTPRAAGKDFVPHQRAIALSSDTTGVDFEQGRDHVTLSFDPGSVQANGTGLVTLTATDRDSAGNPVPNQEVQIEPPVTYDHPALICDGSNRLVYPTRLPSSGSLLGAHFNRFTDANGQVRVTMFVGTVPGDLSVDAGEPNQPRSQWTRASLALGDGGGRPQLPFELPALLLGQGDTTLFAGAETSLLRWLGTLKQVPAHDSNALNGVGFAPIHATDGRGRPHDGVVLFAEGAQAQVLSYLDGKSNAAPPAEQAQVIDVANLHNWQFGQVAAGHLGHSVQSRLQSLSGWENGEIVDFGENAAGHDRRIPIPGHGRPLAGFAHPHGNDDLLYGTGPYPPFGGDPLAVSTYTSCIDRGFTPGTTISAHSPISVVLRGTHGRRAGLTSKGRPTDTLGNTLVTYKGKHVKTISAPSGSYRIDIAGIGRGRATLVVRSGKRTEVFSFRVRRGQRGSLRIKPGRVPASLRFGGKKVHGIDGIRLSVSGLPKSLRRGHSAHLALRVRDQFGAATRGINITLRGPRPQDLLRAQSGPSGSVSLALVPATTGTVTATFTRTGYHTLTRRISVRQ